MIKAVLVILFVMTSFIPLNVYAEDIQNQQQSLIQDQDEIQSVIIPNNKEKTNSFKEILKVVWGYSKVSDQQVENAFLIKETAEKNGVDPALAIAISMKESSLLMKQNKDAKGLFQLNGITRRTLNISTQEASYDRKKNIEAGIRYILILRDQHGFQAPADIIGASFLGPRGWYQKGYNGIDSQGNSGLKHVSTAMRYYLNLLEKGKEFFTPVH